MFKRIALPLIAGAVMFAAPAAQKASAAVRIGVSVGAPVYSAPAPDPYYYQNGAPAYGSAYVDPYAYAPAPVYRNTYVERDRGWRDRDEWREHHDRHDNGSRFRDRDRGYRR